jgi:hypothetical protein
MAGRALPNARFPIEERPERRPIHSTAGSPPHLSRNETRDASAGSPLFTPFPVFGPRGCFEAPFVMYSPTSPPFQATSGRALTRRCSFRFCHRHYTRATKPLLFVLAGPETTSGRGRLESTSVRMLRAAQEPPLRAPLRRRGLCAAAFPFSGRRVVGDTASAKHTTPLVVTLWGPRARRRTMTCNHYHRVTEGPSSSALSAKRNVYRRPEAPSVECIEPELRARLVSECDP